MGRQKFALAVVTAVLLAALPVGKAEAQTFRNCRAVRAKYPNGVAINFARVGTSGAEINRVIYLRNQRLDRDKDGLICEDENLQSIGNTTTTTTTAPVTRRTPVADLSEFVRVYGVALVTIECRGGGTTSIGSGTSIAASFPQPEHVSQGIKSLIVTNQHVVKNCLRGDWLSRQVFVRVGSVECVGYIWTSRVEKDLAGVLSACDFPKVASFTGTTVPRPVIGDIAIIIGSAAGVAGTSTQGAIANTTDNEIFTTAQAAPGSSGGALFNREGQLLGIVQGATGSLTVVIPITKFPDSVYAATVPVTWRS